MKKMKAGAIAVLGLTALLALPACATKTDGETQSESSTTESSEVIADYAITVEAPHAAIVGLPERAKANETVQFKVFAENGYNVTAVTVTTGETTIELTGSYATGFSFTMPEGAVEIKATVVGNISVLSKDETKIQVPNNKDEMFDADINNLLDSIEYDGKKVEAKTANELFIRSGTEVKLNTKHHNSTVADNFYVNGQKLIPDTYTAEEIEAGANESYTFTMPYEDAQITSDQRIRTAKVSLEASDLVTASLFTMDKDGNKTPLGSDPVKIQDKIYVSAKLNEGVDAILDSVFIEYDTYKTETSIATEKTTKLNTRWDSTSESWMESFAFIDADTKGFKLPAVKYASDVKVKFNILTPKYEGTVMCGNFAGVNFYGSSTYGADNLTIDKYGRVSTGSYTHKGSVIITNEDGTYSCLKGSNKYDVYQKGDIVVLGSNTGLKDFYAYAKGSYAKGDVIGRVANVGTQSVCQLLLNSTKEVLATFYVDSANNMLVFDPVIEMISGTNIDDTDAKFQVKVDGKLVFMNYIPETSDPIDGLAFVGKTYRVDYIGDDGYGEDVPAFIQFTFNADNTVTFNAENGEGYTIEGETANFVYFAPFNTIYITHSGENMELYFDETFTSFTGKGKLKGSNYWNKHILADKVFTVVTTAE